MQIAHIEGLQITVCPFCRVVMSADGESFDDLDKVIDAHFLESSDCKKQHDNLPTLTEAFNELRESMGNEVSFDMVPLPFWKTIFSTKPTFCIDVENHFLWAGWWLVTWSRHYTDQLDISISFMPD